MDTRSTSQPHPSAAGVELLNLEHLPALRAWAPTLSELVEQAARGMIALLELEIQSQPREHHILVLQAEEPEDLLAGFLTELLYVLERDELGFDDVTVQIEGDLLRADLQGGLCLRQGKALYRIEAEKLRLHATPAGLEALIPFAG